MKRLAYNLAAALLLLSIASLHTFAATTAGMLRSNGGVSVNGSPVTPVTTVFAGDRIETAPKAVGNLTANRSSLLLDENSSVVFSGQNLDFYCGGGTIQTNEAMSSRYGRLAVKPVKESARYQVQQTGAMLKVSAVEGDLTLTDGTRNYNVPAGNSMNVPYTGCVREVAKNEPADTPNADSSGVNPSAPQPVAVPDSAAVTVSTMISGPATVASVALSGIISVTHNPISPHSP